MLLSDLDTANTCPRFHCFDFHSLTIGHPLQSAPAGQTTTTGRVIAMGLISRDNSNGRLIGHYWGYRWGAYRELCEYWYNHCAGGALVYRYCVEMERLLFVPITTEWVHEYFVLTNTVSTVAVRKRLDVKQVKLGRRENVSFAVHTLTQPTRSKGGYGGGNFPIITLFTWCPSSYPRIILLTFCQFEYSVLTVLTSTRIR